VDADQATALRAPFPPSQIGKLPKAGLQLDYVSHAHVTDRLLQVDPEWTWAPCGTNDQGLPAFTSEGGLWIALTVCGVTRLGYGTGSGPEAVKIAIGDALRNAAMRFGVALDLWEKETPEWAQDTVKIKATRSKPHAPIVDEWSTPPIDPPAGPDTPLSPPAGATPITTGQVKLVNVLADGAGITDRAVLHEGISKLIGRDVSSVKHLTKHEATQVIESLQTRQPKGAA